MAEAVAEIHECLPPLSLQPHWEHFYPTRFGKPLTVMMTACSIIPKAEQVRIASAKQRLSPFILICLCCMQMILPGDLELWDHCMRKLFVLRATPVKDSIVYVAMRIISTRMTY